MKRDSFVVYRSFADALAHADDADQLAVWRAMTDYEFNGVEPEGLSTVAAVAWSLIRPQLDAAADRYERACKGGEFGRLGGRPPKKQVDKAETLKGIDEKPLGATEKTLKGFPKKPLKQNPQTQVGFSTETLNDNGNGTDNDTDNGYENESENVNGARARFGPPSLPELQDFVDREGLEMDAKSFYDYYSARGWMLGITPMVDWRAACRRWATMERQERAKTRTAEPTGYDVGRTSFVGPQPDDADFWNKQPDLSGLEII